jgi:hypothetical protein
MTLTVTHTRTHLTITPANPFLFCAVCFERVEAFHDDRCGCGIDGPLLLFPCLHDRDYIDDCPSWGPVDGCTCDHTRRRP